MKELLERAGSRLNEVVYCQPYVTWIEHGLVTADVMTEAFEAPPASSRSPRGGGCRLRLVS
jgi:hypothetical protein